VQLEGSATPTDVWFDGADDLARDLALHLQFADSLTAFEGDELASCAPFAELAGPGVHVAQLIAAECASTSEWSFSGWRIALGARPETRIVSEEVIRCEPRAPPPGWVDAELHVRRHRTYAGLRVPSQDELQVEWVYHCEVDAIASTIRTGTILRRTRSQ
jgi:hypothetical protein